MDNPQKFDLAIGGITITDERLETMLMSERYLANGKTILCRRSDADRYRSQEKARAARLILLFQT